MDVGGDGDLSHVCLLPRGRSDPGRRRPGLSAVQGSEAGPLPRPPCTAPGRPNLTYRSEPPACLSCARACAELLTFPGPRVGLPLRGETDLLVFRVDGVAGKNHFFSVKHTLI